MNTWAQHRHRLAAKAATALTAAHPGAQVWMTGPLGMGLAHARSDVDILLVTDTPEPALESVMVDGVRIDRAAAQTSRINATRALLSQFEVTTTDLDVFRRVRAAMPELTKLRTALMFTGTGLRPVLGEAERNAYRRWSLADLAESAGSLAEDFLGLDEAGDQEGARIVWQRLSITVAAACAVATGHPAIGEKWLPHITPQWPRHAQRAAHLPDDRAAAWQALAADLTQALATCWPLPPPGPHGAAHGYGWLPQRYSDRWHLRRGDDIHHLTDPQMAHWAATHA